MTIEIRAKVQRHPKVGGTPLGEPWLALVYTLDPEPTEENYHDTYETTWCGSLPEAIQAVTLMRKNIERALMDEVHASRANRRAPQHTCHMCNKPVAAGSTHWNPERSSSCHVFCTECGAPEGEHDWSCQNGPQFKRPDLVSAAMENVHTIRANRREPATNLVELVEGIAFATGAHGSHVGVDVHTVEATA